MCGINIIFNNDRRKPEVNSLISMNKALNHRGPDDNGVFISDGVAFGHTRLSIVDIESGKQPMSSINGQFTITYNGELYNYKTLRKKLEEKGFVFRTNSDTEVVLCLYQEYGELCVEKMRGMYSFSVYDKKTGELYLARDRLGIKPLFYHWTGKSLIAASEMKAIFSSGLVIPKLNVESVKNYFIYQFSIAPHTPFDSVFELEPGHYIKIGPGGKPEINQYWDLEFPENGQYESLDENYWTNEFRFGLENAVSTHTIGDVPIASYLSGGIDSCAITKLLTATYSKPVQTFSIGFSDEQHDESPFYRKVSKYLGVKNDEIRFSDKQDHDYFKLLRDCLYHLEQPQRLSVDIPHFLLSGKVHENGYKVVCTGDGADEILAGYDCFRQDSMRTTSNGLFSPLLRRYRYLNHYTKYFSREHMLLLLELHKRKNQKKTISKYGFYPAWFDFWNITRSQIDDLFVKDIVKSHVSDTQMDGMLQKLKPGLQDRHPLNQSLYFETKSRLPGWILWKSDRLSMSHNVEARVPFVDHHLVELTARIPPSYKLNGMNEKYILKKIMSRKLPELPHNYKKRGFYTPIKEWFFTQKHRQLIEPYFSTTSLTESGIFNPESVTNMYKKILNMEDPCDTNSYYTCMRLEWVLLTVLSVQMLYKLFVEKEAPCFSNN